MSTMMDKLLALELPEPEIKQVKLTRLSKLAGENVVFTLKELPYSRVEAAAKNTEDADIHLLLESVTDPELHSEPWYKDKMGCATPVDAVKKLLRPGEVAALVRETDKLCGYRGMTLEDITKN